MKNTTVLNYVLKIEKDPCFPGNGYLTELKALLQAEIMAENPEVKRTIVSRTKKANAFLNGSARRTFSKGFNYKGYQVLHDRCQGFLLKNPLPVEMEPIETESKRIKTFQVIVDQLLQFQNAEPVTDNRVKAIMQGLKAKTITPEKGSKVKVVEISGGAWIDADKLKTAVEVLGTADLNLYIDGKRFMYILENPVNNEIAFICGIRKA